MYQKMIHRKNSKKGFTLVEVIVVLVILAILAAIMIPSMTKWIDKAKDKSIIVEGRAALLAAQTLASEQYATSTPTVKPANADIQALAGVSGTCTVETMDAANQITKFTYKQSATSKTATYENGVWTVS